MSKSPPLPKPLIEQFRSAADGFSGEASRERIALAVLHYRAFRNKEITVWDVTGTQVYFRLGAPAQNQLPGAKSDRHGITGVHIHLPYATPSVAALVRGPALAPAASASAPSVNPPAPGPAGLNVAPSLQGGASAAPWLTRAGQRKDQIVALVGDPQRPGSANDYVGELLKALEQGRYQASFVTD